MVMNVFVKIQDRQEKRTRWMPFVAPEMTLGRETDNDLVLVRTTVAKKHCKIAHIGDHFAYQHLHRPRDGSTHDARLHSADWRPLPMSADTQSEPALEVAEFGIALEAHSADVRPALNKVKTFLTRHPHHSARQALEAALSHAPLPGHLLHHFAIECAERALLREECAGREPSTRCWEALHVKRRWIEGKSPEKERQAAQSNVEKQVFYCFAEDMYSTAYASYAATAAVSSAAMPGVVFAVESNAVNWAAEAAAAAAAARAAGQCSRHQLRKVWEDALEHEAEWQCQRLTEMIQRAQQVHLQLRALLQHRQQQLSHRVNHWQEQMEQALFA